QLGGVGKGGLDRGEAIFGAGGKRGHGRAIGAAMTARQPLPRLWLMTDERMGDDLWAALERMPRGSGAVFRHYGLPSADRGARFERVRRVARRRRLRLLLGGTPRDAIRWRADGVHGRAAGQLPRGRL